MDNNVVWLTGPQVQRRFSISAMGLYRWQHDERLDFPEPTRIRERLFWRLSDIEAFEKRMIAIGLRKRAAQRESVTA